MSYSIEFVKHLVQNIPNDSKIMLLNRVASFFRIFEARLSSLFTSFLCTEVSILTRDRSRTSCLEMSIKYCSK